MTNEQRFTLSNGVRVLIEELPHVQSVSIGFWVDVGSKAEPAELNGICHFIEHMLFKGTDRRSALDIAQSLEVSGGSLNAFTDKENTCFYARVLDGWTGDDRAHLATLLRRLNEALDADRRR